MNKVKYFSDFRNIEGIVRLLNSDFFKLLKNTITIIDDSSEFGLYFHKPAGSHLDCDIIFGGERVYLNSWIKIQGEEITVDEVISVINKALKELPEVFDLHYRVFNNNINKLL